MPTYAIAEGVRLLGPYQDSGYAEPRFLVRRADGKVILVPELGQHVLDGLLAGGEADLVAQRVSTAVGRELSTEGLSYLVDEKLRPLGLVESVNPDPDASAATEPVKPVTPRGLVLGLRLRRVLVPPRASRAITATSPKPTGSSTATMPGRSLRCLPRPNPCRWGRRISPRSPAR